MSVSICVAISNESKHICNKAPVVMRCCTAFWYRSDSRSWSNQIAFKFMEMLKCIWPIDLIKKNYHLNRVNSSNGVKEANILLCVCVCSIRRLKRNHWKQAKAVHHIINTFHCDSISAKCCCCIETEGRNSTENQITSNRLCVMTKKTHTTVEMKQNKSKEAQKTNNSYN